MINAIIIMNVNDICPISNTPSRKICVESIEGVGVRVGVGVGEGG
jgi:hypothetical protein